MLLNIIPIDFHGDKQRSINFCTHFPNVVGFSRNWWRNAWTVENNGDYITCLDQPLKCLLNTKMKFPQTFITQPGREYEDSILLDIENIVFIHKKNNQNIYPFWNQSFTIYRMFLRWQSTQSMTGLVENRKFSLASPIDPEFSKWNFNYKVILVRRKTFW